MRMPLMSFRYVSCPPSSRPPPPSSPPPPPASAQSAPLHHIALWRCLSLNSCAATQNGMQGALTKQTAPETSSKYILNENESEEPVTFDRAQAAFTEEKALERAGRLHEVKHVFLYALNPDHALIRWDEAYGVHPLDDAFTASMKAIAPHPCCLHLPLPWSPPLRPSP